MSVDGRNLLKLIEPYQAVVVSIEELDELPDEA